MFVGNSSPFRRAAPLFGCLFIHTFFQLSRQRSLIGLCFLPTFYKLVDCRDLLCAVQDVNGPDPLGQIDVVGQRAREVGQQRVEGPEPVRGNGVDDPVKVAVAVSVEANLLGSLLLSESLEGPGPIQAAMGAVRGTGHAVHPGAGSAVSLTFVPLVEMLRLHVAAEADEDACAV